MEANAVAAIRYALAGDWDEVKLQLEPLAKEELDALADIYAQLEDICYQLVDEMETTR